MLRTHLLAGVAWLLGCGYLSTPEQEITDAAGDPPDRVAPCERDADGDGYLSEECGGDDCDDGDAAVHPDAGEVDGWTIETIGGAELVSVNESRGRNVSLSVDPSGMVHVAYADADRMLRHALREDEVWQTAIVDGGARATEIALATDESGVAHVSYRRTALSGAVRLAYAIDASGHWVVTIPDPDSSSAHSTSIALDAFGVPYIAYAAERGLRYATNAGGEWLVEVLEPWDGRGSIGQVALVVDADDVLHVAYRYFSAETRGVLRYGTLRDGSWSVDYLDARLLYGVSLALDPERNPAIAYNGQHTAEDSVLRLTRYQGGWIDEAVNPEHEEFTGHFPSLAFGARGDVQVAYRNFEDGLLRYATNETGAWVAGTVDSEGETGIYCSLAIGPGGDVHLAYVDAVAGDASESILRYAHKPLSDAVDRNCDGLPW